MFQISCVIFLFISVTARACGGAAILGVFTLLTLYLNRRRRPVVRTI